MTGRRGVVLERVGFCCGSLGCAGVGLACSAGVGAARLARIGATGVGGAGLVESFGLSGGLVAGLAARAAGLISRARLGGSGGRAGTVGFWPVGIRAARVGAL